MKKSGAWAWATTLGVVSVLTFFAGLALGYALFNKPAELINLNERIDLTKNTDPEETVSPPESMVNPGNESETKEPEGTIETPPEPVAENPSTSDEFNVARHLFIAVNGQWLADGTREFLQDLQPGGVVLRSRNVVSEEQTRSLVDDIKTAVGLGTAYHDWPLIALNQEGGEQNTLHVPGAESAMDLAIYEDGQESRRLGRLYGETAKLFGVNVVFGPMLDVYNETTAFPDMQTRSFGTDQTQVALQGLAMAEGLRASGVIPVAKHFPGYAFAGYGADGTSVVINSNVNELARAIYPFREAINSSIEGMIVGHVAMPLLDENFPDRPAALSPVLVSDLLRDRWGYEGAIIADEMAFNEMTRSRPVERAVVEALVAGCDAVIFLDPNPRSIQAVVDAINRAVESGELSREALLASQKRLDAWRLNLGAKPEGEELPENTQVAMLPEPTITAPAPTETPEPTPTETPEQSVDTPPSEEAVPPTPAEEPKMEGKPEAPTLEVPNADPKPEEKPAEPTPPPEETPKPVEEPTSDKKPLDPQASKTIEALTVAVEETKLTKLQHTVKEGETLLQIAWDYDVKSEDIIRWNKLESMTVAPATVLNIYTDVPPETAKPAEEETQVAKADPVPAEESKMEKQPEEKPTTTPTEEPKPEEKPIESPAPSEEQKPQEPKPEMKTEEKPKPEEKPATAEEPKAEETPEPTPAEEPKPEEKPAPVEEPKMVETLEPTPAEESKSEEKPEATPELPVGTKTKYKLLHMVQFGETLDSLSKTYGVSKENISAWNELDSPELKANSSLMIYLPSKAAMDKVQAETVVPTKDGKALTSYTVLEGDNLYKISVKYKTTVEYLLQINGLSSANTIRVGQELKVPEV